MSVSIHSYYASPIDTSRRPCISRTCGSMNRGSLRRTILLLTFSILTPSCIILPITFKSSSITEIILINILALIVSYISLQHLSSACLRHQIFDYYNLVYHVLDKPSRIFISFVLVFHWLFIVASYMNMFSFFVPNIYGPLQLNLDSEEEKIYTLILANLFIVLPLSMFKDLENMNFTKFSNAIGVGYVLIISVYGMIFVPGTGKVSWMPEKFVDSPAFACVFSVYVGYYYLPTLEYYLYEPTKARVQKILLRSLLPIGLLYLFISISPIVFSEGSEKSWTSISEELMILLNLIVLIPTSVMTLRNVIYDIADIEPNILPYSLFRNFLISFIVTGIACLVAFFFDRFIVLFCVSGVLNCILMVAVPSIAYLVLLNDQWTRPQKYLAWFYCFIVIGFTSDGLRKAAIM